MIDDPRKIIIFIISAIVLASCAVVWYEITPFKEPKVYSGTITAMYGKEGEVNTGVGIDPGSGNPVFVTTVSSDKFYIILDREQKIQVNERTFISLSEGDYVKFTFYSRSKYDYKIIV